MTSPTRELVLASAAIVVLAVVWVGLCVAFGGGR